MSCSRFLESIFRLDTVSKLNVADLRHYHTHSTECISILVLVQNLYTKFAVHLS